MAVVVAAAALVPATTAGAADPVGRLSSVGGEVRWTGTTALPGSTDAQTVTVALPGDVWARPGGVQIGIRWESEDDDLDLRVTGPDGTTYASEGIVSTAESVLVPEAGNGDWTVSVLNASTREVSYEAFAEVERTVRATPARRLLPDLVSLPARNVQFAVAQYLVKAQPLDVTSCYPEETAEQGARTCLRFDQTIANEGEGPFELRYRMPPQGAKSDPDGPGVLFEELQQRLYWSDGRPPTHRRADDYEFHPAHAHFHYRNFAVSSLWRADDRGRRLDGKAARTGRKNGFCMIDVENSWFAEAGDAARTYRPPGCLAPTQGGTQRDEIVNGISRGWADVYNWFLADQFIEVSGLEDGHYVLESVADPAGTVLEEDETNNCAAVLVRLDMDESGAERHTASLVRPLGDC